MWNINIFSGIVLILFGFSCISPSQKKDKEPIFAYLDSIPIYRSEVDALVAQELYDELCRIYLVRQFALSDLLRDKIFQKVADSLEISQDSLLNMHYNREINDSLLLHYRLMYPQYTTMKQRGDTLIFISEKSKSEFMNIVKAELRDKLYSQLVLKHKITTILKAPTSPRLNINYDIAYYRGNLSSSVTCLIVSDFDCYKCKEYAPVFDSIYSKYKDRIRFGYTYYGSNSTPSSIACECAELQGRFWNMHDSIEKKTYILDSLDLFTLAKQMSLNMDRFLLDYNNPEIANRILSNMRKLEKSGIYGTPTIIVNNRILFNSSSFDDIEQLLLEELKDNPI